MIIILISSTLFDDELAKITMYVIIGMKITMKNPSTFIVEKMSMFILSIFNDEGSIFNDEG